MLQENHKRMAEYPKELERNEVALAQKQKILAHLETESWEPYVKSMDYAIHTVDFATQWFKNFAAERNYGLALFAIERAQKNKQQPTSREIAQFWGAMHNRIANDIRANEYRFAWGQQMQLRLDTDAIDAYKTLIQASATDTDKAELQQDMDKLQQEVGTIQDWLDEYKESNNNIPLPLISGEQANKHREFIRC
jgi:hypothetical protein